MVCISSQIFFTHTAPLPPLPMWFTLVWPKIQLEQQRKGSERKMRKTRREWKNVRQREGAQRALEGEELDLLSAAEGINVYSCVCATYVHTSRWNSNRKWNTCQCQMKMSSTHWKLLSDNEWAIIWHQRFIILETNNHSYSMSAVWDRRFAFLRSQPGDKTCQLTCTEIRGLNSCWGHWAGEVVGLVQRAENSMIH